MSRLVQEALEIVLQKHETNPDGEEKVDVTNHESENRP